MLHMIVVALVVAAFAGAGLFNAIGTATQQASFVRWGYAAWWCRLTGALEIAAAALIAFPAHRVAGLALGAAVMVAAALTVIRAREFSHLAPIAVFVALLLAAGVGS